jgi:hypothetical protein
LKWIECDRLGGALARSSANPGLARIKNFRTGLIDSASELRDRSTEVRDERVILKTVIYHVESGEQISSELLLPQNTDPQKTGSAITYYRRYALCSLLGIVADEDDDGNATIPPKTTQSIPQNNQNNEPTAKQTRFLNIPYNDEEEKAKTIHTEMKKANLLPEVILKIALTKFNSTNIRSLTWEQINQLKLYIQAEGKKSQLTLNNHSVK